MSETHIPFSFIDKEDWRKIFEIIRDEHPQIISLILTHLSESNSSKILSLLDNKEDLLERVSTIRSVEPEFVREVERTLERKLYSGSRENSGFGRSLSILEKSDRSVEKDFIEVLEEKNPELADKFKENFFVFEDLIYLSDKDIKETFSKFEISDIAFALKAVDPQVFHKIYINLNPVRKFLLNRELSKLTKVDIGDVELSQQEITEELRKYKKLNIREYVC
jgi:flagellar motor switch protein FliG